MRSKSYVHSNRFSVLNIEDVCDNKKSITPTPVQTVRVTSVPKQRKRERKTLDIEVVLKTVDTGRGLQVKALIDSGATGLFVDQSVVTANGWNT